MLTTITWIVGGALVSAALVARWYLAPERELRRTVRRAPVHAIRDGLRSRQWLFNKALRYRERAIVVGQQVTALGNAVRERDPDAEAVGGYRDAPPTRLRLVPRVQAPLLVTDEA